MPRRKRTTDQSDALQFMEGAVLLDSDPKPSVAFATNYSRFESGDLNSSLNTTSFPHLRNMTRPFRETAGAHQLDTRDAVALCINAYWQFPLLRNVIEVMVELSNSPLFLTGGNQRTRDFVSSWLDKTQMSNLGEEFFREFFRSANVHILRLDGQFAPEDWGKLQQIYGAVSKTIPVGYMLLNPENITCQHVFGSPRRQYIKLLTTFEIEKIKAPETEEEIAFCNQLPPAVLKDIREGRRNNIPLNPTQLTSLLYKTQGYEPTGVPFAFGVLDDIEAKMELKRIDLSVARATDRALLHFKVGESPNEWNKGATTANTKTLAAVESALRQESVARTLVTAHTVTGEWLIPDIGKILGEAKYAQLDKDIARGLNAILFESGETFANTSIKVQIFLERLKAARSCFLKNFLQPEINRVCRAIGAKSTPIAEFQELAFRDELQYAKLAVTMAQLGILTATELLDAQKTGKMPSPEESLVNQEAYQTLRQRGLYMPLLGGSTQLMSDQLDLQAKQVNNDIALSKQQPAVTSKPTGAAGRPTGAKAPKTGGGKTSPIGKSKASIEGFSLPELGRIASKVSDLQDKFDEGLRQRWGVESLNAAQDEMSKLIVASIISNEPVDKWLEVIPEYIEHPKEMNDAARASIDSIRIEHDVDDYAAAILALSKTNP